METRRHSGEFADLVHIRRNGSEHGAFLYPHPNSIVKGLLNALTQGCVQARLLAHSFNRPSFVPQVSQDRRDDKFRNGAVGDPEKKRLLIDAIARDITTSPNDNAYDTQVHGTTSYPGSIPDVPTTSTQRHSTKHPRGTRSQKPQHICGATSYSMGGLPKRLPCLRLMASAGDHTPANKSSHSSSSWLSKSTNSSQP